MLKIPRNIGMRALCYAHISIKCIITTLEAPTAEPGTEASSFQAVMRDSFPAPKL